MAIYNEEEDDVCFSDIEGEELFDHDSLMQKSRELGLLPPSDVSNIPPGSFFLHYPCTVLRVLVNNNTQVKKRQPMFIVKAQPPPPPPPPPPSPPLLLTELEKISIKKNLEKEVGLVKQEFNAHMHHHDHLLQPKIFKLINFGKQVDWFDNIQKELSILEKHSPETISVRCYESRKDVFSALIVGQEGTPYHDGLFLFDVFIPDRFPNLPPVVRYRSGPPPGISPQLKKNGELRMFLLNTNTTREYLWVPGTSNILQLLLSIQVLVLNSLPLFNAPFYTNCRRKVVGERNALLYNENITITSLKTMVYIMNKTPKNFKDCVVVHFRKRVREILTACKAYMEGLPAVGGCLVSGDNHTCSNKFKQDVASCIKPLIEAFNNIGAKEAQDFLCLTEKKISDSLPLIESPSLFSHPSSLSVWTRTCLHALSPLKKKSYLIVCL